MAKALQQLETLGLVKLPKLDASMQHKGERVIVVGAGSAAEQEIAGTVREVGPVEVEPVGGKEAMQLWNEYVHRYHPLGYKQPFGAHQRYFLVGRGGRRLGCLLFASSAWALRERDAWIGWTERDRQQRLNWVVANSRFLIFPWVRIKNLASKALSLAAQRIRKDWEERYGYGPVLLETFVEVARYDGGPAIKRPTGFAWGRRVGEDGWIVTRDTYRLPGRSTCIRWCRSFVRFCKGRAEKARGSDELPGAQRRPETAETGAETGGERATQTSGRRGSRESADGHDRERNESLEDGAGGTAGATGSGGRTAPSVSFRPAHVVEAVGEDPRPAESENDPTPINGVAVVRDTPVCLPDGLATRS